jgi:hypothetical protein
MTRFIQNVQVGLDLAPQHDWSRPRESAWSYLARYRQHAFRAFRRLSTAVSEQVDLAYGFTKPRGFIGRGRSVRPSSSAAAQERANRQPAAALSDATVRPVGKVPGVVARIDLPLGHAVFIRGEGGGLDWHRGARLDCLAPGVWIWSVGGLTQKIVFQLLLNDSIWARGADITLQPGGRVELVPDFE